MTPSCQHLQIHLPRWSSTGWAPTTGGMGWLATTWPGPMCQTSGLPIGEGTLYICNNDDKTDKGKVMTLDQDLCNRHQGRLTKTTIRTSTLNSSDMTMTRTNVMILRLPRCLQAKSYACLQVCFGNNVIYLFRHETLLDELSNIFKCVISNWIFETFANNTFSNNFLHISHFPHNFSIVFKR